MKLHFPNFSIKIATSKPKIRTKNKIISRKCLAVVKRIDGKLKAIINIDNQRIQLKEDEISNEQLVLPFTESSLDLKDKTHVFLRRKDKHKHYVCIIRSPEEAHISPGLPTQYKTLHENLLIAGHIVDKLGRMYFEYETLVSFNYLSNCTIECVRIDKDKPLFNK